MKSRSAMGFSMWRSRSGWDAKWRVVLATLCFSLAGVSGTVQICSAQTIPAPSQQPGEQDNQDGQLAGQAAVCADSSFSCPDQGEVIGEQRPLSINQAPMSADQIIDVLQQQPDMVSNIKDGMAKKLAVDPATISDQQVYDRLRQDAGLRQRVTVELRNRGFFSDRPSDTLDDSNSEQQGEKADSSPKTRAMNRQPNQKPRLENATPPPDEQSDPFQLRLRAVPYKNIPSLHDLYSQVSPDAGKLRRFGSDTFKLGTGNASELPMDLPAGPDYVLGPGDTLVINMWGGQSNRLNRTIDRQGQIALPEAGTITIFGLTITQAQSAIQKALGTQFQNEHVEISLGRLRTVRIYVVGDVERPGAYDISSLSTPLNALYAAGGPTSRGSLRTLKHYRGKELVSEIDLYDLLLHGVRSQMDRLLSGDTILVPPVGPQVKVEGMVRRPAIYKLRGPQDVGEVLVLAGGPLVSASLAQIRVDRVEAHQRHTMLSAQIGDGAKGSDPKLPGLAMQDGDDVFVSPILPYNEQVVYLDGHVFRPGRYPWREGMTVNDLLHSYQDVMPEPADHGEIVRLQAPDFRPETIPFDLPNMLIGNDPIELKPFDVVRVFSRYEIDPPKVSIYGEVLRPGEYPMSQGMTVVGLVRMAGGFRRSAYREAADLTNYTVQNGEKVLLQHSVVDIGKALNGDNSADVPLDPGDVVGIRQLTGWKDIGASVTIDGEVKYPGTYGIQEGEHLSSVLKRVGGLREDAYPAGAVLDRVYVREVGEKNRQQMIDRIERTTPNVKSGLSSTQDQQSLLQAMQQQQQQVLASLRNHPASGRMVIQISSDIAKWENTPADIEMRAGDRLSMPKRPDFVVVSGQVYNATAISYAPGREADWYLRKAGGVTQSGNKKDIFIVRADGSVVGRSGGPWGRSVLTVRLRPGDSVIVPEKVVGGSQIWKDVIATAQIMSSVAITGAAAGIL